MGTQLLSYTKIFFLSLAFLLLSKAQQAQSSLYMPGPINWVGVGDLDVPGNQITVEALIYYTGSSVDIVSKHTSPADVNYLLRIGSFEISTTSGFAAFSGAAAAGVSLVPNRMYHVAATYDGAMLRYYVNGCLTGSMPWTGNMLQNNLTTAIGNMSSCQCEQFTGYIDEVRIWNVARTAAQISANMMNLPSPTTQPGLLGYWKFDGSMVNLQGNAAYNGTAVGAPLYQAIPLPYPSTLHETVTSADPICSGTPTGQINVAASGYYLPYEYSLDGVTYSTSPSFPNMAAGTYTVYTRPQNNNSCAVSSSVTLTDPAALNANFTSTNVTCNGAANGTAAVAPSGGDGPTYHQLWQPSLSTATNISGLSPGSYSVNVIDTCRAAGPELVTNAQFEDGNTGFTSGYTCCAGGPGNYAVDTDPTYYNAGHIGAGFGGGGNYLILDGSTTPGTSAWCQTISVTPYSYYTFSAEVSSSYVTATAVMEFDINGSSVGTVNAPATTSVWTPFSTVWFSGASTTASICIIDQNTISGGNDYGLDDISFRACSSCNVTVPFTITEPAALTVTTTQTNVSCNGGSNGTATATAAGGTVSYSYSWNTSPVQTTATAINLAPGSYTVTVTDNNLCTTFSSVTITQPPILNLLLDHKTNPACAGDANGTIFTTPTGGSGGYTFSWTPNVSTVDSASGLAAGNYAITVSDANSCSVTLNVTLTSPTVLTTAPSATATSICRGSSTTLNANAGGGTTGYTYLWSNSATTAIQTVTPSITTTYTVTVTDAMSCSASNTVSITVFQPAVINLGNDTAICQGDALTLDAGSGFTGYLWQNGANTQTITATVADQYYVSALDANGCLSKDTLLLNINPLPVIGLADTVKICPGTTTTLTANPGYVSYAWNTGASTASITTGSSGSDKVTVQDANGCTNSDSTFVVLYPLPQLSFTATPLTGCEALDVTTQNNSILNGAVVQSWNWQIGTDPYNGFSPSGTLATAGMYNLYLQATTDHGCIVDSTMSNYIAVYPTPMALIVPQSYTYELTDDEMFISNQSTNADTYVWSLYGLPVSTDINLTYPVADSGHYQFQLLALNAYGCRDSTDVTITVNPSYAIYFPNAFTPNGNGNNDTYRPEGYGIKTYELLIYDRWGNLVFKSNDINTGWDGKVGGAAPFRDIYVYRCKMRDIRGVQHYYTGPITLIQ